MQFFRTIVSGTMVFVLGQAVLKLVIEPWQHHREAVAYVLDRCQAVYANSGVRTREVQDEAAEAVRCCAAELMASFNRILMRARRPR